MKKRYNKLVAYLLMNFSLCSLFLPVSLVIPTKEFIIAGVISAVITVLLTLYINSRTPKGERVGTWFRAWWLGFKIALKISLCCTLILIPAMLKWSIDMAAEDSSSKSAHWYDERGRVRDDNGNEYKVGRSGEYVEDKDGNWKKVDRNKDGDPYISDGDKKIWLH